MQQISDLCLLVTKLSLGVCPFMIYLYPLPPSRFEAPPAELTKSLREGGYDIFHRPTLANRNFVLLLGYSVFSSRPPRLKYVSIRQVLQFYGIALERVQIYSQIRDH
ncbi:hypothetical protein RF11_14422 [Thelohanellus kitauei]|uniref:Uncharacterized protein n=1 Tax=Thelohanellus kitauei TaxID=669202 RepID=A0A0C2MDM4_THEKT|nr:hypothetical protein RF11_14422 [Thelohanellus kitauei]